MLQTKKQNLQIYILSDLKKFQIQLNLVSDYVYSNEYATDMKFPMFSAFFEQLLFLPNFDPEDGMLPLPEIQLEKLQEYFDQLQKMSDDFGALIKKAEDKKASPASVLPQQRNMFKQLNLFHLDVLIQKLFIERL